MYYNKHKSFFLHQENDGAHLVPNTPQCRKTFLLHIFYVFILSVSLFAFPCLFLIFDFNFFSVEAGKLLLWIKCGLSIIIHLEQLFINLFWWHSWSDLLSELCDVIWSKRKYPSYKRTNIPIKENILNVFVHLKMLGDIE